MSNQRSLLRSVRTGIAGRAHKCRANAKHALAKGDPILVVKIERNEYHYCAACAVKFMNTARARLQDIEDDLTAVSSTARIDKGAEKDAGGRQLSPDRR